MPTLTSCFRQAYFLSPFNTTTNYYHAIPLNSDSIKSATYISGAVSAGGANDFYNDEVYSLHGYFHRSHSFKKFQAYYGANASVGSYPVEPGSYYSGNYNNPPINYDAGSKFFGGFGISGGMNLVMPMGTRHEWRVIGIETSLQNEYGQYLDFRKRIPDSAADAIHKHTLFTTVGLTTEFVFKLKKGGSIGYKLAIGSSLQKTNRFYYGYYDNYRASFVPAYISNTFQITRNQVTGFGQLNLGSYAANFQAGISYRLGSNKKASK
jgi:hypothetical protein